MKFNRVRVRQSFQLGVSTPHALVVKYDLSHTALHMTKLVDNRPKQANKLIYRNILSELCPGSLRGVGCSNIFQGSGSDGISKPSRRLVIGRGLAKISAILNK